MKTELLKIIEDLEQGTITQKESRILLLGVLGVVRTPFGEAKTLNDFIIDSLLISEDKRKLPFLTQCPNGLEVYPSIKMKFENYGSSLIGDKLEAMMVTWRD